jgi:SAM-dependent methyltransferase
MPAPSRTAVPDSGEAVWQDVEYGSYDADLPVWEELAGRSSPADRPCRVLDLGCGIGRVSIALARDGCEVTGVDLDPLLLEALRERSLAEGLDVEVSLGDARSLTLAAGFDLVIAPMQLFQLFGSARERRAALKAIAGHLRTGGRAGIALLDPDDLRHAHHDVPLLPDLRERDSWVHSSQPVAGRITRGGRALELERRRDVVSPAGELTRSFSRVRLTLLSPRQLEQEARAVGLIREPRRRVPPTADHVGSVVIVMRAP